MPCNPITSCIKTSTKVFPHFPIYMDLFGFLHPPSPTGERERQEPSPFSLSPHLPLFHHYLSPSLSPRLYLLYLYDHLLFVAHLVNRLFLWPLISLPIALFVWWVVVMMKQQQQQQRRRKAPMESSPSSSSYPVGDQARARWKHQSLLQDYNELLKETEAKKIRLQKTVERKHKLMAEVKFLRKKYKSFSENPTETRLRLKKKSHNIRSPAVRVAPPPNPVNQSELPMKDSRNRRVKETAAPTTSTRLLDLNQVSMPSFEEMQEYQMEWEPREVEKLNMHPADEEAADNDLKLSICRDVGSNANRAGKRKISWQEPVAFEGLKLCSTIS